jgi:hypothetical protein
MRDDLTRITVAQWNKIKRVIPQEIEPDQELTPRFGYIVDNFRILYDIYISVTPIQDRKELVRGYRGTVFKLSGNNIENVWTNTEQSYYLAMRVIIDKAFEFITD